MLRIGETAVLTSEMCYFSMSTGYGLSIIAIAGCLAIGPALAVPPISRQQDNAEGGSSRPKQDQSEIANREFIAALQAIKNAINALVSQEFESDERKTEAAAEKQRSEDDLNEQKAMAWWAMWMSFAAGIQILVSTAGVCLLLRNLKLVRESNANARQSTRTAIKATKAAQKSADIQEESFRRLERPYLFVRLTNTDGLRVSRPGQIPWLSYTLVNYGKMPAILRSISVRLQNNPEFPLRIPMAIAEQFVEVIAPQEQLTTEQTVNVENGQAGDKYDGQEATLLVMHGIIQYEDPTGAFHTDGFAVRGNSGSQSFRIDGGSEYNWHRTLPPCHTTEHAVIGPD